VVFINNDSLKYVLRFKLTHEMTLKPYQVLFKRLLDITLAIVGVVLSFPVLGLLLVIAAVNTNSSGLLAQKRIGKNGIPFMLYKLKTMRDENEASTFITTAKDKRITTFGRFLRKTKLDELPQLWNVLIGKMSFVGPRPDVPGYADQLQGDDRIILSVRPGITGPASLAFRDEEELLAEQEDPQQYNDEVIWPEKVRINKDYIRNYSLLKDIKLIFKTVLE